MTDSGGEFELGRVYTVPNSNFGLGQKIIGK